MRMMKARVYGRQLVPGGFVLFLHIAGFIASLVIWRWFVQIGTPVRDSKGGVRVGEDLTGKGVIEMAWDV